MRDTDTELAGHLLRQRWATRAELEEGERLVDALAEAGLEASLGEILIRRGTLEAERLRAAWRAAGGKPKGAPSGLLFEERPDPDRDAALARRILRSGRLREDDLEQVRRFQAWFEERGLYLSLAEILVGQRLLTKRQIEQPSGGKTSQRERPARARRSASRSRRWFLVGAPAVAAAIAGTVVLARGRAAPAGPREEDRREPSIAATAGEDPTAPDPGVPAGEPSDTERLDEALNAGRFEEGLAIVDGILARRARTGLLGWKRAMALSSLGDKRGALAELDRAERCFEPTAEAPKTLGAILSMRSQLRIYALDFEGARRDLERYAGLGHNEAHASYLLGNLLASVGDLDGAAESYRRSLGIQEYFHARIGLGLSLLEKGKREDALAAFEEAERIAARPGEGAGAIACRALAWLHPAAGPIDVERARSILEDGTDRGGPLVYGAIARTLLLHQSKRPRLSHLSFSTELETQAIAHPLVAIASAEAALALGRLDQARESLRIAWILRPATTERHPFDPASAGIVAIAREEARELASGPAGLERVAELRSRSAWLEPIERLEAVYRFEEAAREYERSAASFGSLAVRREFDRGRDRAAALARVHARAIEAASDGGLREVPTGEGWGRIVGATSDVLVLDRGETSAELPWALVPLPLFVRVAGCLEPAPGEAAALAELALRFGVDEGLDPLLVRAHGDSATRGWAERVLAARRGSAPIPEGFRLIDGRFLAPGEEDRLARGELLFRGRWMPRDAYEKLIQGARPEAGVWTRLDDGDLVLRGLEPFGESWLRSSEIHRAPARDLLGQVARGSTLVRTNRSAVFAGELARLLEGVRHALGSALGEDLGSHSLGVFAFKDLESYRAYCLRVGRHDLVLQPGFTIDGEGLCGTGDLTGDTGLFQEALVHQAVHTLVRAHWPHPIPGWLEEGLAGAFDGSALDADAEVVPRASRRWIEVLRRVRAKGDVDPATWFGPESGSCGSPEFRARSLGIVEALLRSSDPNVQQCREDLFRAVRAGRGASFLESLPEDRRRRLAAGLETYLRRY